VSGFGGGASSITISTEVASGGGASGGECGQISMAINAAA
jgi:hypothetical protein